MAQPIEHADLDAEADVLGVVGGRQLDGAMVAYRSNLPRHLIAIAHDMQSRVLHGLTERYGYADLRLRFGPMLALLWNGGRTVVELSNELGISKQACSQLVSTIERGGYFERRNHPRDRRSRLVCLTRRGRTLAQRGAACIAEVEAGYAALVGAQRYAGFARSVNGLSDLLGLPPRPRDIEGALGEDSAAVIALVSERVQRWLMDAATDRGHHGLKMSHGQVLPFIGPGGGRIHAIARRQGVSRQAIHAIAKDLEQLGYLVRAPDPRDGRGSTLLLSPRGETLIHDSVRAVRDLDARIKIVLGDSAVTLQCDVARELYEALQLEAEVFGPDENVETLAARLRERLGRGDVRRLASLLEEPKGRTR